MKALPLNRFERGPYRRHPAFKIDGPLALFLERIAPFRGRILDLRMFGSRARGDERPDSDSDLFVALDRRDRAVIDALHDAALDVLLATGRVVTLTNSRFDTPIQIEILRFST